METIAFLAYYDARWVFGWRVRPLVLGLAMAFQTVALLWGVWGFNVGLGPWMCAFRICLSFVLLIQLLRLVLDDQPDFLFQELFASLWYYAALKSGLDDFQLVSDPTFTLTSAALTRTYEGVFFLVTVIVAMGLLIKTGVLLLSLAKPRLHLRMYGYRDN
jgi:hypothetical protein